MGDELGISMRTVADGIGVLSVAGLIAEPNWQQFQDGLLAGVAAIPAGGALILEIAGVIYMGSRALRALMIGLKAARADGKVISICNPSERMWEILRISNYDKLFGVHDDETAAIVAAKARP